MLRCSECCAAVSALNMRGTLTIGAPCLEFGMGCLRRVLLPFPVCLCVVCLPLKGHAFADRLSSYSSSLGATQSGANHIAMIIFGWFAVFGDVVSQAAQAFMPSSVNPSPPYPPPEYW